MRIKDVKPRTKALLNTLLCVLFALPVITVPGSILFYYQLAHDQLGYPPRYNNPDPKDIPLGEAYLATSILTEIGILLELTLVVTICALLVIHIFRRFLSPWTLAWIGLGRLLFWGFLFSPVMEWFLD